MPGCPLCFLLSVSFNCVFCFNCLPCIFPTVCYVFLLSPDFCQHTSLAETTALTGRSRRYRGSLASHGRRCIAAPAARPMRPRWSSCKINCRARRFRGHRGDPADRGHRSDPADVRRRSWWRASRRPEAPKSRHVAPRSPPRPAEAAARAMQVRRRSWWRNMGGVEMYMSWSLPKFNVPQSKEQISG